MNAQQMLFLRAVVPAALASMRASGVPASITIAQAILESGWGKSSLAVKANNFFGIKAAPGCDFIEMPTTEYINGERVTVQAAFARYASVEDCFKAHARLLSAAPRYVPCVAVKDQPEAFARQLQACGYSTSPTYAAMLIALMKQFDLTQYDLVAA
jgi:flagellum-specific peptidoglycan hydrolase FlgJ